MTKATVRETNLTGSAYAALRADLLSCRLRPGAKLNIAELSALLAVSLGAVRESLSRLTAEGLVTTEMNRGFRAAPVSRGEMLDLTSTRIDIEVACLRRAMRVGGVDWETRIVAAHHRLARTPGRVSGDLGRISDEWAIAHKDFHTALVSACDSPWRMRLRGLLYDQTERYRRLAAPALPPERDLAAEHRGLMEATLAREEKRAAALLGAHLSLTADRMPALASMEERAPDVPRQHAARPRAAAE